MGSRPMFEGGVALVFPGQGSQFVGMGQHLLDTSPVARETVAEADEVLGFDLSGLMANGPAETLEDTVNAQPAILAVSVAALRAMRARLAEEGTAIGPIVVAGHSLGEFSALVAADSLDYPAALRLVRRRGELMKEAGQTRPGAMAAVLGLEDDALAQVCVDVGDTGIVVMANQNCPGQTVISGETAALERAMELAKERGAKRVARLGVSIASHSPLMAAAAAEFAVVVGETPIATPVAPVVGNVTAQPLTTVEAIRDELGRQMASPVLWTGSVQAMVGTGARTFVELGPGAVLAGLIKRIDREVATKSLADLGLGLPLMTA